MAQAICIDIDTRDSQTLFEIIEILERITYSLDDGSNRALKVICNDSGKKGYHVWINLVPTRIETVLQIRSYLGKLLNGYDKIEPSNRNRRSNLIKLPLGVHPISKQRCHFVDLDSFPDELDIRWIDLDKLSVPGERLLRALMEEVGEPATNPSSSESAVQFSFPCVQSYLDNGFSGPPIEGQRHNVTLIVANMLAKKFPRDKARAIELGQQWIRKLDPETYDCSLDDAMQDMKDQIDRCYLSGNEPYCLGCKKSQFADWLKSRCDKSNCILNPSKRDASVSIPKAILHSPRLDSPTLKAVLLAHHSLQSQFEAKYRGTAVESCYYAPHNQIAERAKVSERTAAKYTNQLIKKGFLIEISLKNIPHEFKNHRGRMAKWYRIKQFSDDELDRLVDEWAAPWE